MDCEAAGSDVIRTAFLSTDRIGSPTSALLETAARYVLTAKIIVHVDLYKRLKTVIQPNLRRRDKIVKHQPTDRATSIKKERKYGGIALPMQERKMPDAGLRFVEI